MDVNLQNQNYNTINVTFVSTEYLLLKAHSSAPFLNNTFIPNEAKNVREGYINGENLLVNFSIYQPFFFRFTEVSCWDEGEDRPFVPLSKPKSSSNLLPGAGKCFLIKDCNTPLGEKRKRRIKTERNWKADSSRNFDKEKASLFSYGGNLTFISSFDTKKIVHGSSEIRNFSSNIYRIGCPITFSDVFLCA